MASVCRYKAFISYSHTDRAQAKRLLRSLENYRLPKHLRRQVAGDTEIVPTRVGTLFRDREELPAAEDLTAEVKKALTESEFMIVLCSPAAAASRWVNREIIEFKKLNGEGKILSVILSGEPFATDKGQPGEECFPPALRFRLAADGRLTTTPAEPLAADMRPGGDGYRRAILKLVAGLLGIGLDALIERDLQRKMRRVTAVTAASLIAVLGMGALTYEAITARQEAEHHRNEAEGLIEFMLTDLKDKLEPIAGIDAMAAIGEQAAGFHPEERLDNLPPDAMGRRARALHFLGELDLNRGDETLGKARLNAAHDITSQLYAQYPGKPQHVYEHAQSVFWLGLLDWADGNYDPAFTAFKTYERLASTLLAEDPDNPRWQKEVAYANSTVGTTLLQQYSQPDEALKNFETALINFKALVDQDPDSLQAQRDLADAYAWMADVSLVEKHLDDARRFRERETAIYQSILSDTCFAKQTKRDMLTAIRSLASVSFDSGDAETASSHYRNASHLARTLPACDPENAEWQEQKVFTLLYFADAQLALGDLPSAADALAEARPLATSLLKTRETARRKIELAVWATVLDARYHFLAGNADAALEHLSPALEAMVTDLDMVLDVGRGPYIYASAQMLYGQLLLYQGEVAQAAFDALADTLQPMMKTLSPDVLGLLARSHALAGREEEARSITANLTTRGYARPDFTQLSNYPN